MNKILVLGFVCLLLVGGGFYFLNEEKELTIEEKLKDPFAIQEEYGGGVIVSYDTETGELTGIRRQDYTVQPREGALSLTSDEADKIGIENLPKNVVIITGDKTYFEIMEDRKK